MFKRAMICVVFCCALMMSSPKALIAGDLETPKSQPSSVSLSSDCPADPALLAKGHIAGRITNSSGIGISHVEVSAYKDGSLKMSRNSDSDGLYWLGSSVSFPPCWIDGLYTGSYDLYFDPPAPYLGGWYSLNPVQVTSPNTTYENVTLDEGGVISGRVTDINGSGIQNIKVWACTTEGIQLAFGYTDSNGYYETYSTGLWPDIYKVYFDSVASGYQGEWYNDKPDLSSADRVPVTLGTTSGIDAVLVTSVSRISGNVTDETGNPLANIDVYANPVDDAGNYDSSRSSSFANTNSDGFYCIIGPSSGNYKIRFSPPSGQNYISEYYNDKSTFSTADAITVIAGNETSEINAALAIGGKITGKVINEAVYPLASAYVYAYPLDAAGNVDWYKGYGLASIGPDGTYAIIGLRSGNYKIRFSPPSGQNYIYEYYNNKANLNMADLVTVTAGAETSGINAALAVGGKITGKVTNEASSPLFNASIYASPVDDAGNWDSSRSDGHVYTGSDGNYTIIGLRTGKYKVSFSSSSGQNYISEYYNKKSTAGAADSILVNAGAETSGINAALAVGAKITGKVTNEAGIPIANVSVVANPVDDFGNYDISRPAGSYSTGSDGTYAIIGLRTGKYKLHFYPWDSDYTSEWYNNKLTFESADIVYLVAPGETSAINAALAQGSVSISGAISYSGGDVYPTKVSVMTTYSPEAGFSGEVDSTTLWTYDGSYSIKHLPAGSYYICAWKDINNNGIWDQCIDARGFYGDGTPEKATVAPGGELTNVNLTIKVLTRYENTDPSTAYSGTWSNPALYTSASGGSVAKSNTTGSKARFTFTGNTVSFITLKSVNRGIAKVTIDGVSKDDLDLYSPIAKFKVMYTYAGLGSGNHTIEIEVKGTKNPAATGCCVDIDAFDAEGA